MSLFWLVAWLIKGRPRVRMFGDWNNWGIALGVTLALDLLSAVGRGAGGGRRMMKANRRSAEPLPQPVPVGQ